MNSALIALGIGAAVIIVLVAAAFWLHRKGEASGKRTVQADVLEAQNERLQTGAKIDAQPMSTDDAIAVADKLADR